MRRLAWLLTLGSLLVAAGCGGSSKSPATPSVTTAAPTTATSTATAPTTTQTATSRAVAVGGPVPAGFVPHSFTAIGEDSWWLLGIAPCSSPPCTSIVRTTDGGADFVGIPAPRVAYESTPGSGGQTTGISQLRFADVEDGFAYDSSLYATHNGGATWHSVGVGGSVTDLAIAAGDVYAVVGPAGGGSGRLMRSPVGSDDWVVVQSAGAVAGGLWVHGFDVFIQSADNTRLLVSGDRGGSFKAYRSPVEGLPCQYELMVAPVVWAHCATGTLSAVWRSTDGGHSFKLAYGGASRRGPILPNSAEFAAASARTAVVGYQKLFRTSNAGGSYSVVSSARLQWDYLGFTDATHGAALAFPWSASAAHERLYYTTDGGRSYHVVPIT